MRLRPVIQARFDHGSSVHVECHQGTRGEVLATLCSWLRPDDPRLHELPAPVVPAQSDRPILWVYAFPGVGKSTVARTAAIWWDADKVLGATFFAAKDGQRSNILGIFRTIAYQLARKFPEFREEITKILENDPDLYAATPSRQLEKLLVEPLQVEAVQAAFRVHGRIPVIIDALDECTDKAAVSTILTSLALYMSDSESKLTPLWFLITSRQEENITKGFLQRALDENTQSFNLNDVSQDLTKRDIEKFVRSRFEDIRRLSRPTLPSDWPSPSQLTQLLNLADVLFIYAATAMLFIGDEKARDPQGRLDHLLKSGNAAAAVSGAASTSPLDNLYVQVLEDAIRQLAEELQAGLPRLLLGTLVLAEERLTPSTLAALVGLPSGVVEASLPAFHAVMTVPADDDHSTPIRLIHLSFTNFLVDSARCTNPTFLVKPSIQHSFLALRCLKLMQDSLKYNICEVPPEHDHLLNSDIPGLAARITQRLPPALQYACRYYLHHLVLADIGEDLLTALKEFCIKHLIHWLEATSLLGCVDGAAEALRCTQLYLKQRCPQETEVLSLLYDCERMLCAFYPAISVSYMQVYRTAIPFSPTNSPLRRLHQADASHLVDLRVGSENAWSTTLAWRVTGSATVMALVFSPDGIHVACCADDRSIQLLNTHTAAQMQSFEGHTDLVHCVSFSPTGKEILSGSHDKTTKLWDVATGACLHTWEGHSGNVTSVAWSPDGAFVASGGDDGNVIVRMVATPVKMVVLGGACHVAFAADGTLVATTWCEASCKVWDTRQLDWDATDNAPSWTLEDYDQSVCGVVAVAVSPDSCLVACGLSNGKIVLWRKSDGQRLHSFPGGGDEIMALAFYPDSRLAAAYEDSPFVLWDVSTATPLDTVDNAGAYAVAFSPDGVHIAHADGSTVQIRRWSGSASQESKSKKTTASSPAIRAKRWLHLLLSALRSSPVMEGRADKLLTDAKRVAVSPTGALILAVFKEEWRLWDVSNGRWTRTGKHAGSGNTVTILAWSPSGNLFACKNVGVVGVWETETGKLVGSSTGHSDSLSRVVFTADEQHLLFALSNGSIRRWKVRQTPQEASCDVLFQSDGNNIDAFCVSSDGQWLLSGSRRFGSPPDTSSADLLAKPSRQPMQRYYCWPIFWALRLHDATGRVVWIEHHPCSITSVAFSEDCTRALTGNINGEMFLYDLTQLIPPDKSAPRSPPPLAVPEYRFSSGSTDPVYYVSFAPGDQGIVTERSYTQLSSDLQPLLRRAVDAPLPPAYFMIDDGWLWHVNPTLSPRRICWIHPTLRPSQCYYRFTRIWSSHHEHRIAHRASDGRLVVIDTSQALCH
ncbi:WD40 repeat-like protein [Trametes sanguinea]|nr:WD40 repeat-like protein [Trametes sanguinea]